MAVGDQIRWQRFQPTMRMQAGAASTHHIWDRLFISGPRMVFFGSQIYVGFWSLLETFRMLSAQMVSIQPWWQNTICPSTSISATVLTCPLSKHSSIASQIEWPRKDLGCRRRLPRIHEAVPRRKRWNVFWENIMSEVSTCFFSLSIPAWVWRHAFPNDGQDYRDELPSTFHERS